eukprot:g8564.t1
MMTAALEKLKGESAAPQTQEPLDDLNDEGMEGEEEEGACADDEIVEEFNVLNDYAGFVLRTHAAEIALSRTEEFRPKELAALGWALAASAQEAPKTPEMWRQAARTALEVALEEPHTGRGGRLLAQTAWACASMQAASQPLLDRLANALAYHCGGKQRILSNQDVANGIWALSIMSCQSPSLEAMVKEAELRIQTFEARQLAACAWALATTRYQSKTWLEDWEVLAAAAAATSHSKLLGVSAWVLASCEVPKLLEALLPNAVQLLQNPDKVSAETLLQLAWAISFSGLGTKQRPLLLRIEDLLRLEGRRRDAAIREDLSGMGTVVEAETAEVAEAEAPSIVLQEQDFVIVHKPVHWEVDDGDMRKPSGRRPFPLSRFLQQRFPSRTVLLDWSILHDVTVGGGFQGRLDAQSSGLVLCALTYEAFLLLQFRQDTHDVAREYLVLCHGWMPATLREVSAPIWSKDASSLVDYDRGAPAKTFLQPIAWFRRSGEQDLYSLVVISIVTGRKHQIRCHLAHVGHPVVCDGRYAPQEPGLAEDLPKDLTWCPRNFLHRFRIELPGLALGDKVVACDTLPEDLRQVLCRLLPANQDASAVLKSLAAGQAPLPFADWRCQLGGSKSSAHLHLGRLRFKS